LSPSLGAIEVIVKSTVDAHDSSDEDQEDGQGHTVFLHLKKFFRGAPLYKYLVSKQDGSKIPYTCTSGSGW
jgi:hypothetical protein